MATIESNPLTHLDVVKRQTQDGRMIATAEVLNQKNGIHQDFEFREGDLANAHMTATRTSLPEVHDKAANDGIPDSKATDAQNVEAPMTLAGVRKTEDDVARFGGNPAAKLVDQDVAFTESMVQGFANRSVYGNHLTNPDQIEGIMKRYAVKSGAVEGRNILLAGGGGADNASILLVGHGPVYAWYPKGTTGGLEMEDFGRQSRSETIGGVKKEVVYWVKHFRWSFGLAIADWRFIVRIANIDISDLAGGTPPDLILLMQQALDLIPDLANCRPAFYTTRTVKSWLARQFYTSVKAGGGLDYTNVAGRRMMVFQEVPVNTLDQMSEAEALVA